MKNDLMTTAWVRLVRARTTAGDAIEAALKANELPSLAWYDVLLELERAERPIRAKALEAELLLAQYNLSRLLDRLEERRLIERSTDPDDGRGRLISISAAGRTLRAKMWPVYRDAIREAFGRRLSSDELRALGDLLRKLTNPTGVDEGLPGPPNHLCRA